MNLTTLFRLILHNSKSYNKRYIDSANFYNHNLNIVQAKQTIFFKKICMLLSLQEYISVVSMIERVEPGHILLENT